MGLQKITRALFVSAITSFVFTSGFSSLAIAGDLEWSGQYRIEGYYIDNPEVKGGQKKSKEYGVHHLILRPRIVAADGLYINSQIQFLNSNVGGPQLGSLWGSDIGDGSPTSSEDSAAASEHGAQENLVLSEFYMTYAQEYGALLVGRAPLEFGLGMTYNAGKGLFDHYYDNRDLVAYKFVFGNFFVQPMIAKVKEGGISGYDDISETLIQLQYESAESNTAMGFMYNNRKAGSAGNDYPTDTAGTQFGSDTPYNAQATPQGSLDIKTMNIFYSKSWGNDRIGFEIVNQTGDYGVVNGSGQGISQSAFAGAFEYQRVSEARFNWGVKAGWASGDDPSTTNEYEGFHFDRNYDVALLMFNQAMGRVNLLRTEGLGTRYNQGAPAVNSARSAPDVEAISNVMYFAPRFSYKWRDNWNLEGVIATGWLDQTEYAGIGEADNSLGYEFDFSVVYSPYERLTWRNTLAVFMPGGAYDLGGGSSAAYGLVSRAAISF